MNLWQIERQVDMKQFHVSTIGELSTNPAKRVFKAMKQGS
jgi:hypothetical protein